MGFQCKPETPEGPSWGRLPALPGPHARHDQPVRCMRRGSAMSRSRRVPVNMVVHCPKCWEDLPKGISLGDWIEVELRASDRGLFVLTCKRHDVNVLHVSRDSFKPRPVAAKTGRANTVYFPDHPDSGPADQTTCQPCASGLDRVGVLLRRILIRFADRPRPGIAARSRAHAQGASGTVPPGASPCPSLRVCRVPSPLA
jgi:hypothetical protein